MSSPPPSFRLTVKHVLRGPHRVGDEERNQEPPLGVFHGDQVTASGELVAPAWTTKTFVGILDLVNRTRYGFSSRGVPQYLFHPLDVRYPPMIVGSKAATTVNQWCVVRYDRATAGWNIQKDKWPRAALQELLGPTTDKAVEQTARRRQIMLGGPKIASTAVPAIECSSNDETRPWDRVFNIDPDGCRDVDDIVAWRWISIASGEEGCWEFAIAIANVAAWVPAGSPLDDGARARVSTVYEEGRVVHPMLPPWLSEDRASLLADGVARPVVAFVWRLSADGTHVVADPVLQTCHLVNQTTYTYESVLADPVIAEKLPTFLHTVGSSVLDDTCVLRRDLEDAVGWKKDPHVWIEVAMVTYNVLAARRLLEAGSGILRSHQGQGQGQGQREDYLDLAEKTGCADIRLLGLSAGTYVNMGAEKGHAGLGLAVYCHASSPLRRYADLVNQRILLGEGMLWSHADLVSLQERAKDIRAFERSMCWVSRLIVGGTTDVEGWVLKSAVDAEGIQCVSVYVPEWRQTIRTRFLTTSEVETVEAGQRVRLLAYMDSRAARCEDRFVFQIICDS